MMKVIFLDVDGVLNSARDRFSTKLVSEYHFDFLKELVDATGAKIVLSSSWRIGFNAMRHPEKNLLTKLESRGLEIYDFTPIMTGTRGDEIREWLTTHPVDSFVILDDEDDMAEFADTHLVKTDMAVGLQDSDVEKAIAMLGRISDEEKKQ